MINFEFKFINLRNWRTPFFGLLWEWSAGDLWRFRKVLEAHYVSFNSIIQLLFNSIHYVLFNIKLKEIYETTTKWSNGCLTNWSNRRSRVSRYYLKVCSTNLNFWFQHFISTRLPCWTAWSRGTTTWRWCSSTRRPPTTRCCSPSSRTLTVRPRSTTSTLSRYVLILRTDNIWSLSSGGG